MKILFIGDVFGNKGRAAIKQELKKYRKDVDLVIANVENCTHGKSISLQHYEELMKYGVDYFTFGNHTWGNSEYNLVLNKKNCIRPLNIIENHPKSLIGKGTITFTYKKKKIRITNILGSTAFCHNIQTNPFLSLNALLVNDDSDIHIVDLHTETTSEKNAFLLSFAGKVSAILGTHTHVQTADNKIFKDTAYITDVGMTGSSSGIIGAEPETILDMFWARTERFKLKTDSSDYQFNAVIVEFDDKTNKPISIERVFNYERK